MSTDVIKIIKSVTPFNSLTLEVLNELIPKIKIKDYFPGDYVFKQGEPSQRCLFIISHGSAEITVTGEKGTEAVVGFRQQLDFFGETVVLTDLTYPASVRAKEQMSCFLLARKELEHLINNHSDFAGFFSQILSERMRVLYEEIVTEQSFEAYGSVDTPLFSKRVSEIMSTPVLTCHPRQSVKSAVDMMFKKNISTLVVADDNLKPLGMITEKGLLKSFVTGNITSIADCITGDIMEYNLVTISPNSFFNQALLAIIKHQVKCLIVVDREKLVGIVTLMDLVKARNTGTLLLTSEIESKDSLDELVATGRQINSILYALVAEKAAISAIMEIMTELHDRLTRKIIEICEKEMILKGWGEPPVDYAWIHMGSAGRREMTLRTDQDNAIVYANPDEQQAQNVAAYFHELAAGIVNGLEKCGFAKCKGGVMASNPLWCQSLNGWRETVHEWMKKGLPENVRALTIFLDFRYIYGSRALVHKLHNIVQTIDPVSDTTVIVSHLLTQDDIKFKVPLNLLGGFVTNKNEPHRGQINLKNAAAIHIVNCIRVFAVKYSIPFTSTFDRIRVLNEQKILPPDDAELVSAAYETLMMFRIRENVKKFKQGQQPDNYVNPYRLSKREQALLKDSFTAITRLQKLTSNRFSIYWLSYFSQ